MWRNPDIDDGDIYFPKVGKAKFSLEANFVMMLPLFLKFSFSEKTTKICVNVKTIRQNAQIFAPFSEKTNLKKNK